jgi:hypothetical protein
MREHRIFDNKIFGCGKTYYSNSIIITTFMQTLIPNCWFENVFPTYCGIKISQQNFHILFSEFIPDLGMWDLWWDKVALGRFSPSSSVSPAIVVHSTNYSTITLMDHPGNV